MTDAIAAAELAPRGFSFANCKRNANLLGSGYTMPKMTKTGTTIVGLVYKDGVILGSDTRATNGNIVSDKVCQKLHPMSKKIYCAGAGTAADCDKVSKMVSSQLTIHALNTGRDPRICTLVHILSQYLYRYQGVVGCALIVGGVDATGAHLSSVSPHGNVMNLPYITMGSGSLSAVGVLESQWKHNLEFDAAVRLVRDALAAGVLNDMGSGSNVDIVAITQAGAKLLRPYEVVCKKGERSRHYTYKVGCSAVLEKRVAMLELESKFVRSVSQAEPMEM